MIAYQIHNPDRVLVLGAPNGPHLLRRSTFVKRWCGNAKRAQTARKKGLLVDVAVVDFDEDEARWRVETDSIGRPCLVVGPAVALAYCCQDQTDRTIDAQLGDLLAPRGWIAREAAQAAAALAHRIGVEMERVAV